MRETVHLSNAKKNLCPHHNHAQEGSGSFGRLGTGTLDLGSAKVLPARPQFSKRTKRDATVLLVTEVVPTFAPAACDSRCKFSETSSSGTSSRSLTPHDGPTPNFNQFHKDTNENLLGLQCKFRATNNSGGQTQKTPPLKKNTDHSGLEV